MVVKGPPIVILGIVEGITKEETNEETIVSAYINVCYSCVWL